MSEATPFCSSFGKIIHSEGKALGDLSRDQVATLFREAGALVFRGFDVDDAGFQEFTERFGDQFLQHGIGKRPKVEGANQHTVQANIGKFPLVLHNEMSYFPISPAVLWFFCIKPADQDGETTLCDSVELSARLSDAQRAAVSQQRLLYAYPARRHGGFFQRYSPDEVAALLPATERFEYLTVEPGRMLDQLEEFYGPLIAPKLRQTLESEFPDSLTEQDELVLIKYLTPAIKPSRYGAQPAFANSAMQFAQNAKFHGFVYFEDGSQLPQELVAEIQAIADELTVPVDWQPGDIAMIDNSRLLHGRRAYKDVAREIHVRMAASAV